MVKTPTLGGTASHIVVAKVAHGLMTMTCVVPDEQAFDAIKSGVDALPSGVKMILNSAEFYGKGWSVGNLEMLSQFYEKYPDYAEKTFLSVKVTTKENIRRSVDRCIAALRGTKKIDMFQPARIAKGTNVEEMIHIFVQLLLVQEGKFDHLGLSECSAHSLRGAHAIHPISCVEIEISPMSYEEETKKVIAAAKELNVAVAGYSCPKPLGHGLTTGSIQSVADLANSPFNAWTRFQEETWQYNRRLVDGLVSMASKKGCTPAQLSIAWVASLGEKVIPLPGSSRQERTLENLFGADVELSPADLEEIAQIMATNPVRGDRYLGDETPEVSGNLWG
ncbi:aldo/keto reductase [Earliella scabrosa]|nr:aldo/keto reductase [Earliella scabrosa]